MHPAKISWPTSNAARERKFLADGLNAAVATQQSGEVLTDVYDFTPLMAQSKGMQLHVVQRPANATTGTMSWADFEVALQTCHNATITDDLCGENTWMDNHMGFSIHGNNNRVATDAQKLKQLSTKLALPFHVTPSNGGGVAVYAIAGNGLSITFQVPTGTYKPPRPLDESAGMLDLCDNGSCPDTCANKCDDTGECAGQCADLVKMYPCADYYAPGKEYAGWCDKTCDYGNCKEA